MCHDCRGRVKVNSTCPRYPERTGMGWGGVGICRFSIPPNTLQALGCGCPLASLDHTEDTKPEQRKHNTAAYRGQVL